MKPHLDPQAAAYNAKGFELARILSNLTQLIRNHDQYVRGIIKEFIKDHTGQNDRRISLNSLVELPQVAIEDYLCDYERLR